MLSPSKEDSQDLFSHQKLHFPLLIKQSSIKTAVNFLRSVYPVLAVLLCADRANQPLWSGLNFPSRDTISPWLCPKPPALWPTHPPAGPSLGAGCIPQRRQKPLS